MYMYVCTALLFYPGGHTQDENDVNMTTKYREGDWNGQELVSAITVQAKKEMNAEEVSCLAFYQKSESSQRVKVSGVLNSTHLNVTCKYFLLFKLQILHKVMFAVQMSS